MTDTHLVTTKTDPRSIHGDAFKPDVADFGDDIAFEDHKIAFAVKYCRGKSVLDIGCVQHNPENYRSRYWLHKALVAVADSVVGIDLFEAGVRYLNDRGFDVRLADAQQFELDRKFDVIVAGDVIEHLEDFHGFLASCKLHMHSGSHLLVSTPNPWYWKYVVKAAIKVEVDNNPEHTCWLCPRTLRQLTNRHGLEVGEIVFGSRYRQDRWMPLPRGWKHTSFHAEIHLGTT